MAGIGFQLRKLLNQGTISATASAYLYASLVSSGPWVISILTLLAIGIISIGYVLPTWAVTQFLVSITYLIAGSLIFTGGFQLMFTRFVADRLFEKKERIILPNVNGLLIVITASSGLCGLLFVASQFDEPWLYRILMLANFVVLCNMWVVVIFVTSMKNYKTVLGTIFLGYSLVFLTSVVLRHYHMEGLLTAFLFGHCVLLFTLLYLTYRQHPGRTFVAFDFLRHRQIYISLFLTGLFYYLGIWADKFLFWYNLETSEAIIGPLRSSRIYDVPIFLAYLTIIPGLAIFLVRMETDFSEHYDRFYTAVRDGDELRHLYYLKDQMTLAIRQGIFEIFKVQGFTILLCFMLAPAIFKAINMSGIYLPLFYVDLVGTNLQVLFMSIMNVLFYLDRRREVMELTFLMLVLNILLTLLSQALGTAYYGYGFTLSLLVVNVIGMVTLNRLLRDLEYETFMLQRV